MGRGWTGHICPVPRQSWVLSPCLNLFHGTTAKRKQNSEPVPFWNLQKYAMGALSGKTRVLYTSHDWFCHFWLVDSNASVIDQNISEFLKSVILSSPRAMHWAPQTLNWHAHFFWAIETAVKQNLIASTPSVSLFGSENIKSELDGGK